MLNVHSCSTDGRHNYTVGKHYDEGWAAFKLVAKGPRVGNRCCRVRSVTLAWHSLLIYDGLRHACAKKRYTQERSQGTKSRRVHHKNFQRSHSETPRVYLILKIGTVHLARLIRPKSHLVGDFGGYFFQHKKLKEVRSNNRHSCATWKPRATEPTHKHCLWVIATLQKQQQVLYGQNRFCFKSLK